MHIPARLVSHGTPFVHFYPGATSERTPMSDTPFPLEFLVPLPGRLTGAPDDVELTVPLASFSLDGVEVNTAIRLDGFSLPVPAFSALEGRTHFFPVNPEPGYIAGSVYIRHAHNPVDVTAIRFGALKNGVLEAALTGVILFTFENSGFSDLTFHLDVALTLPPVAT